MVKVLRPSFLPEIETKERPKSLGPHAVLELKVWLKYLVVFRKAAGPPGNLNLFHKKSWQRKSHPATKTIPNGTSISSTRRSLHRIAASAAAWSSARLALGFGKKCATSSTGCSKIRGMSTLIFRFLSQRVFSQKKRPTSTVSRKNALWSHIIASKTTPTAAASSSIRRQNSRKSSSFGRLRRPLFGIPIATGSKAIATCRF